LSAQSDVMETLTSYIVNDPEARAWLEGKPEPWGMVVNPHYNIARPDPEIALPTNSWRLLDAFVPKGFGAVAGCPQFDQLPYLPQVASPLSTLSKIALDMEFSISTSQIFCPAFDPNGPQPQLRAVGRQSGG